MPERVRARLTHILVDRAARSRSPLCVLMIDLDKFKPINDRYGHAEGDRLLGSVADAIRGQVRTNDIVACYGGDEFVVVMPDTSADEAREVARRVASGIRHGTHQLSSGQQVAVDSSVGLGIYPDDGRTAAELLQAADAAMYQSKRAAGGQGEELPPRISGRALAASAG